MRRKRAATKRIQPGDLCSERQIKKPLTQKNTSTATSPKSSR